jgi:hypothetical protein
MQTDDAPRRRVSHALLALTVVPPIILIAATAVAHVIARIPLAVFSRDPTATLGGNPLTGVQSHVGVLVWWVAAGICIFAAAVVQRSGGGSRPVQFLLWSGSITAVLTLDDLFQVHEDLAVRYLGINDKVVVLAYGLAVLTYLVRFRRFILRTHYPLLVAGLGLFAGSNAVDLVLQARWLSDWRIFVEDGLKLLGIACWSAYLIDTAFQLAGHTAKGELPAPRS